MTIRAQSPIVEVCAAAAALLDVIDSDLPEVCLAERRMRAALRAHHTAEREQWGPVQSRSRSWIQEMPMALATSGGALAVALSDCTDRLGALAPGWTRFVRLAVTDLPPSAQREADEQPRAREPAFGAERR